MSREEKKELLKKILQILDDNDLTDDHSFEVQCARDEIIALLGD